MFFWQQNQPIPKEHTNNLMLISSYSWMLLSWTSSFHCKGLETRKFFQKHLFYMQLLWNFQSLNKKIQKDQLKDDSQKLFYLVTYAFSSKRWSFTGKIQLISKLMTRFLMFVRKKEGIREFIFLTSLLSLSFLHTVTSMIWNVTPMTDFVIR